MKCLIFLRPWPIREVTLADVYTHSRIAEMKYMSESIRCTTLLPPFSYRWL